MSKQKLAVAVALAGMSLGAHAADTAEHGFIEDSKLSLGLRNFYINTDNRDGAGANKNEEWGQGFDLRFISGYTQGTVQFGVDAIGLYGVRLDSSPATSGNSSGAASGGTVFPSDGNKAVPDYASLGLTGKVKISQTELKVGTLMPNNPVVKYNDGRLLPQTFQGAAITSSEIKDLTLTAGQLEHAKGRNSSNNEGLSIANANASSNYDKGQFSNKFYYAGADYKITKDLVASYYYGELKDFYSQNFLGLVHNWAIGPGVLKSDLRYYRSRDNGANGNDSAYYSPGYYGGTTTKGKVDNNLYSYLALYTIVGHTFGAGYQVSSGDSDFPWLNQGDGSSASITTDMQIQKFARAGERTWQARYGYDFAALGLPGLTASAVYLKGSDISHPTGDKTEWERDVSLAYVIPQGDLKGLGFAWKNAMWRNDIPTVRSQDENRLIVSYTRNFF
ncbi:OprD family porin [Pseudomonas veronii]|uniref:OprD family porin n=1 Tax=Pseudomonas veronii TaxID=76761 RepID=UPI0015A24AD1|nr:OprD family porin [Pseudomonas veronii]NWD57463.1 OprD family porin [Pseudomonas veronii]